MMIDGLPRMLLQTDDVAGRCEEILATVARPDLVRLVEWTEEDYSGILDRGDLSPWRVLIEADIGSGGEDDAPWAGIGTGQYGVASVRLRADQEKLAATLLERYGRLIELEVGNFAYPPDPGDQATALACQTLPEGNAAATVSVTKVALVGDLDTGQFEVVVSNTGPAVVHLVPDRVAELTEPGATQLVSLFTGAMTDEARESLPVEPGAEITIRAIPSKASCDADTGYSLPGGSYDLVLRCCPSMSSTQKHRRETRRATCCWHAWRSKFRSEQPRRRCLHGGSFAGFFGVGACTSFASVCARSTVE